MIDGLSTESSKTDVLPRITIDHELKCNKYINYPCKRQLIALATVMDVNKKKSTRKDFIDAQKLALSSNKNVP